MRRPKISTWFHKKKKTNWGGGSLGFAGEDNKINKERWGKRKWRKPLGGV